VAHQKRFQSVDSYNEEAENEIAVFNLSDTELCNAIRSYEKRKASKKEKCKDLEVLTKTPQLNRFF